MQLAFRHSPPSVPLFNENDDDTSTTFSEEHIVHQAALSFQYDPRTPVNASVWPTPGLRSAQTGKKTKREPGEGLEGVSRLLRVPYIYPCNVESYDINKISTTVGLAGLVLKQGNRRLMLSALETLEPGKRELLKEAMMDAYDGWSLIFFAVHAPRKDLVRYFLQHGTSPHIVTSHGIPLIAFVILSEANRDVADMVKVVEEYGADVTAIPHFDWMGENRWEMELRLDARLTEDVKSALSEPPRKTSDVAFPHLRPSQIRHVKVPERLVEPTHLVTTGGERKPKVIVLSYDEARPVYILRSILSALDTQSLVLCAKTMEELPELRPRYIHSALKALKGGPTNEMPLEDFLRSLGGKRGILAIYDITDSAQNQTTALGELARIWTSGIYQSKRDGAVFNTQDVTLMLTLQLDKPHNIQHVSAEMRKHPELRKLAGMVTCAVQWSAKDSPQSVCRMLSLAMDPPKQVPQQSPPTNSPAIKSVEKFTHDLVASRTTGSRNGSPESPSPLAFDLDAEHTTAMRNLTTGHSPVKSNAGSDSKRRTRKGFR